MAAHSKILCSCSQRWLLNVKKLSKYKLSAWVTATGASGYLMVLPIVSVDLLSTCGGLFLCSAAAHAFNQIIERESDAVMLRTRTRPLPSKSVTPLQAGLIGTSFTLAGSSLLYSGGGLHAAALALANIGLYTLAYTPLKKKTEWNTHVGSIVGSIPPLIGCLAAGGTLSTPEPWLLFGLMYAWQIPHFYSLAWLYRKDYLNANFKMYGINDDSGKRMGSASVKWIMFLSTLPLLYNVCGFAPPGLLIASAIPNFIISQKAIRLYKNPTHETTRNLYIHSLWHILVLITLTSYYSSRGTDRYANILRGKTKESIQ